MFTLCFGAVFVYYNEKRVQNISINKVYYNFKLIDSTMDGHLSESFIEELLQLEDDERFYEKLGLPVPAAEESDNEMSENCEDNSDELDEIRNVNIDEEIVQNIIAEKYCTLDVTDEIPVSILISVYTIFFNLQNCDISLGYKI